MNIRALLVSAHYIGVALFICLWPALLVSFLVRLVAPDWEVTTFIVVYSRLLTEFVFNRKDNWFS